MSNILEDLYNGKIFPYENLVPKNPDFPSLIEKINETTTYLRDLLPDADKRIFDSLEEMKSNLSDMENAESFSRGFRLAVMVIVDVYYNKGDLTDIRKLFDIGKSE